MTNLTATIEHQILIHKLSLVCKAISKKETDTAKTAKRVVEYITHTTPERRVKNNACSTRSTVQRLRAYCRKKEEIQAKAECNLALDSLEHTFKTVFTAISI